MKDIVGLEVNDWKSMNLPLNIFLMLRKRLEEINSSSTSNVSNVNVVNNPNPNPILNPSQINQTNQTNNNFNNLVIKEVEKNENINTKKIETKEEKSNNKMEIDDEVKKTVSNLKEKEYSQLERIMEEISNFEKASDFFKDLELVIENIINNPSEEKFRKLKIESGLFSRSFTPYKQSIAFLEFVIISFNE